MPSLSYSIRGNNILGFLVSRFIVYNLRPKVKMRSFMIWHHIGTKLSQTGTALRFTWEIPYARMGIVKIYTQAENSSPVCGLHHTLDAGKKHKVVIKTYAFPLSYHLMNRYYLIVNGLKRCL